MATLTLWRGSPDTNSFASGKFNFSWKKDSSKSTAKHDKGLQFSIKPLELKNNLCAIWYQAYCRSEVCANQYQALLM